MALPIAHSAVAYGLSGRRNLRVTALLAFLSIAPDFDFAFVWFAGLPMHSFHRTYSHSVLFAVLVAWAWTRFRPAWLQDVSGRLVFLALISHGFLDMACTADVADHGVMFLWPLDFRFGWPILVPLYRLFGESPHSFYGAVRFSALEFLLIPVFVLVGQSLSWLTGFISLSVTTRKVRQVDSSS